MVQVKICGITNPEDALFAVEAGADALGFNFYPQSPRYITPLRARSIIEILPQTVLCVGVFVNESLENVTRIANEAGLSGLQFHGDETPEYASAVDNQPAGRRFLIKALRVGTEFNPETAARYETDAILLDAFDRRARGGTGQRIDWEVARRTRELVPKLFLAGGLGPDNIKEAIQTVAPYGVDACSALESSPGRKDRARVRDFILRAHAAHVKP
jgi:phosphoribosylanthranilate isomerase